MKLHLPHKIRAFRTENGVTQEALAEVLGVSVGAVYKWEKGLSQPSLQNLAVMADFFDTSVDVLIGYEAFDNRLAASVARLKAYFHEKDRAGLEYAERTLVRYPHAFEIVYASADLYFVFGLEAQDKRKFARAVELYESSLALLSQNRNPEIGETTIYGAMAQAALAMGRTEEALEMLRAHNTDGIFNTTIGVTLATDDARYEEALVPLSNALIKHVSELVGTGSGYLNVYLRQEDFASAEALALWMTTLLAGLRNEAHPSVFDKTNAVFHVILAHIALKTNDAAKAETYLRTAKNIADRFDTAGSYDVRGIRFVTIEKQATAYDTLGETAEIAIHNICVQLENEELTALWKEVSHES